MKNIFFIGMAPWLFATSFQARVQVVGIGTTTCDVVSSKGALLRVGSTSTMNSLATGLLIFDYKISTINVKRSNKGLIIEIPYYFSQSLWLA